MAALVIVVVKIRGHTLLGIGQVAENRPLSGFEFFGFEARSQALGLGIVQAFGPATLRAQAAVFSQQGAVAVATVPPAAVRMHSQGASYKM